MNKISLLLIISVLLLFPLLADSSFMGDDPLVVDLQRIYNDLGLSFPVSHFPVYSSELHKYINQLIERYGPSDRLNQYLESLDYYNRSINLSGEARIVYEHDFRSINLWPDVSRRYLEEDPVLMLNGSLYREGQGGFCIQMDIKRNYDPFFDNNWFIGNFGDPVAVENQFVRRGVLYLQWEDLYFSFGRDFFHLGDGRWSSFYPSSKLPFLDSLILKYHLGPVTMSAAYSTLENRSMENDVNISSSKENAPILFFEQNTIITAQHRFGIAHEWFKAGIGAVSIIARPLNGFQLGDFFPVFSWHNADVGWHNLSMILDFGVVPLPHFSIYTQMGFDDINIEEITGGLIVDGGVPTIWAYLLGIEYSHDFEDVLTLMARVETGGTHYLWGNFYDHQENSSESHGLSRAVYRIFLEGGNQYIPLTSPYGPGVFWLDFNLSTTAFYGVSADFEVSYQYKNMKADLIDLAYREQNDLLAEENWMHCIDLSLRIEYSPWDWASIWVNPKWVHYEGRDAAEIGLGISFQYSGIKKWKDLF